MELKSISKKARAIWLIRNIISLMLLTVVFTISFVATFDKIFTFIQIILIALYLTAAVLLIIWPFLTYKRYLYGYDDKRFFISRGVIFKHQITVPLCQIQDLHLFEGPVMRIFGIGRILFSTGGSNFDISGIAASDAAKIIQEIEGRLRQRIEVIENEEI